MEVVGGEIGSGVGTKGGGMNVVGTDEIGERGERRKEPWMGSGKGEPFINSGLMEIVGFNIV